MSRQKIDYAIDLGTTNSAIAREDKGRIKTFQIEPFKKTIMPSCVSYSKSQINVGDLAYNKLFNPKDKNTFSEFKRTMGSDVTYHSERTGKHYTSEELSSEVLRQLKISVKDEVFSSVVITVPADFIQVQIEATRRAAEMAGFEYFELLQEPIAASLAYLNEQKEIKGAWLVFDLGGGTFDAAIVKMEDGIMNVVDHAGDNHLGGKNMDWLIVDEIIIPHLKKNFSIEKVLNDEGLRMDLRKKWKPYAEVAKIELTERSTSVIEPDAPLCNDDDGNDIDTAISIDRSDYESLILPLVIRAISICKELITRNRLSTSDLMSILMVGGPTYIPILRRKVKEEISQNIDVTINPMTVVAEGAAFFASTRPVPVGKQKRDYSRIQLTLAYPDTTAETEVVFGIKIDTEKTTGTIPSKVFAEITRNDKGWTSGRIELKGDVAVLNIDLIENSTNSFSIHLFNEAGDKLEGEPNLVSILQGIKIAQPPLPHDIGVSAVVRSSGNEEEMIPILFKGSPLPIVDKKAFLAPKNLRPGNSSDVMKIIFWEGKGGTVPIRNVYMGEVVISGDMLSSLLPEGSEVEVTIRLDESRRAQVSAYLPYLDETIEGVLDVDYKHSAVPAEELSYHIDEERERLSELRDGEWGTNELGSNMDTIENDINDLEELNEKGRGDSDRSREVEKRLNELAAKLDKIEKNIKWPQKENELNEDLVSTEQVVDRFGKDGEEQMLLQLKSEVEKVIELKNIKRADYVIEKLQILKYDILFREPGYWISVLSNINESFEEIQWSNRSKARNLVDRGGELLANDQYSDEIRSIVGDLWDLMPDSDEKKTKETRKDIPVY